MAHLGPSTRAADAAGTTSRAKWVLDEHPENPAMRRLRNVASDAGKHLTRHAFIKPDEAAEILTEIERLQAGYHALIAAAGWKPGAERT